MAKLSLNPDPGFDINVAFNTMNKRLGELVNSGKMSLDQARAAQSEMRALQLNPAAANRQAATDIFQRHLQVGKYHPENVAAAQRAAERAAQQPQGGLTLAQPAQGAGGIGQSVNPVTPPQEIMVSPQRMPEIATLPVSQPQELPVAPMQPDMPERHSEYGIPLWMQLRGPERDAAYAQYMKGQGGGMQPKGIGGMLNALKKMQLPQGVGGMPPQGSPNALTIGRGPVPLDQQGPALGGGIGAFLGRPGDALQGGGMMPRLAEMLKPKQPQGSFVDTMPKAIVDDNFRFGETTQQMPQNAQAMALGGLMAKYRGGMC